MIARPRVIVQPAVEPLSWTEAAAHLRGVYEEERSYVEALITAVRINLEHRCNKAFIEQTLEITLDYWPSGWCGVAQPYIGPYSWGTTYYGSGIELPRATPLVSVEAFTYRDSTGASTAVDAANYVLDTDSMPGRLALASGYSWPSFTPYPTSPIRIRYVAGHRGMTSSPYIPYPDEDIKHAMRLLVGHFYTNREAVVVGDHITIQPYQMELAVSTLLANHEAPNIF